MLRNTTLLTIFPLASLITLGGCSTNTPAPTLPENLKATPFESVSSNFTHKWDKKVVFPFTGGAAIDIDNDGSMEVFVSGGNKQGDALLSLKGKKLVNTIQGTGLSQQVASYGATAVDIDNNGHTDLLVARNDGVWLHLNRGNGKFSNQRISYDRGNDEAPMTVAVADIDHDNDMDLYISNFITFTKWKSSTFNQPDHIQYNRLLRNDGNLKFTDITKSAGVAGSQNTFLSAFTDLDQDGYQDLVVSNNTGTLEIFHNNRNNTFSKNSYNSGLGYWMGLGVGDYDNDGDQDIAVSNVSNSISTRFLRGDLRPDQKLTLEWQLLRNDGQRRFTDVAASTGLTGHGFGWGIVFEDLNLDGQLDALAAQSYIKWPPHQLSPLSGRVLLQTANGGKRSFLNAPSLKLENSNFGQSAIVADLDGDAKQDVVWVNMNGPVKASLNRHPGDVVTLAVPENSRWLGAKVTAISSAGKSYTREVTNAIGMQTDQTPHLSFAVPTGATIDTLQVRFANGQQQTIKPKVNELTRP